MKQILSLTKIVFDIAFIIYASIILNRFIIFFNLENQNKQKRLAGGLTSEFQDKIVRKCDILFMLRSSITYSVTSGLFAALSGFLGKVTFDPEVIVSTLKGHLHESNPNFTFFIQGVLGCFLILSNILMLQTFNKALQTSSTTIQASIVNTASNFIFTAIIGKLAFDEHLTLLWWCGTTLILFGIFLINPEDHGRNKQD